jgi:UDP-N-acetyl-D-galactosamine dehydrogenase
VRNTKVIDIVHELQEYNIDVDVYDPWVDAVEAQREYGVKPVNEPTANSYDSIILAVAHSEFVDMGVAHIRSLGKHNHVLYDLKYVFAKEDTDIRL